MLRNPSGAIITSNSFITLFYNASRYDSLYLTCRQFQSHLIHGPRVGDNSILCRVDVDSAMGSILTGATAPNCAVMLSDHSYKTLDFRLEDATGKAVTLRDDSLCFLLVVA